MSTTVIATSIATVVAAVVAGGFGYLVQRTAAKASVKNATIASRGDIERDAFERAKAFYTDVIDRQQAEIQDLESDVRDLKGALLDVQTDLRACRDECRRMSAALAQAKGRLPMVFPEEGS